MAKKKNSQDATLRNTRPLKSKVEKLEATVKKLKKDFEAFKKEMYRGRFYGNI